MFHTLPSFVYYFFSQTLLLSNSFFILNICTVIFLRRSHYSFQPNHHSASWTDDCKAHFVSMSDLPVVLIALSSANILLDPVHICWGRSFLNITKRKGPSVEPCWTPILMLQMPQLMPLHDTDGLRPLGQCFNHCNSGSNCCMCIAGVKTLFGVKKAHHNKFTLVKGFIPNIDYTMETMIFKKKQKSVIIKPCLMKWDQICEWTSLPIIMLIFPRTAIGL